MARAGAKGSSARAVAAKVLSGLGYADRAPQRFEDWLRYIWVGNYRGLPGGMVYFLDLTEHITQRPRMYGQTLQEIRAFLTGYFLGFHQKGFRDQHADCFHGNFGDFVDEKYSSRSTAKNWAHLISEQEPSNFDLQIEIFSNLLREFWDRMELKSRS